MRSNGFESPYNGMQITTWILFPILFVQFFLFITTTLPIAISIPATVLFTGFGILGSYFGYVTSKTDPIDTKLYEHINGRPHPRALEQKSKISQRGISIISNGEDGDDVENSKKEEQKTKYCWVCQTDVYENSMHCKYCNKCVGTFDHHCMWLNNCIGDANYHLFFRTVCCVLLFSSTHVVALIIHLSLYFGGHESTRTLSNTWLNAGVPEIVVGFNIGFLVLTVCTVILVGQLFTFHINLRREKITTYQFIIRDGQKKREEWHLHQKVEQRRGQVIKNLNDQGKGCEAAWMKIMGKSICVRCDPIVPIVKKEIQAAATADEHDDEENESSSGGSPGEDEKKSERDSITR